MLYVRKIVRNRTFPPPDTHTHLLRGLLLTYADFFLMSLIKVTGFLASMNAKTFAKPAKRDQNDVQIQNVNEDCSSDVIVGCRRCCSDVIVGCVL